MRLSGLGELLDKKVGRGSHHVGRAGDEDGGDGLRQRGGRLGVVEKPSLVSLNTFLQGLEPGVSVYLIIKFEDQRCLPALYLDPVSLLLSSAAVPVNLCLAQRDPQYRKFSQISPSSLVSGSHRSWGLLLRILSAVE